MSTQTISQKSKVVKKEKDRLGSAIVSLITGIFSILFLLLGFSMGEPRMALIVMSGILSIIGLPLGIRARKSSSGRGLAIAGITLTVVPFIITIVGGILVFVFAYWTARRV
ncbi:hypothetical protein [Paenibacillus sp. GCM10012306]|uniref:hypothetical protein n=1 Tax=Paenibacillus sp. GCM10012306 TaxID=3317342 RepID=UPI00360757C3